MINNVQTVNQCINVTSSLTVVFYMIVFFSEVFITSTSQTLLFQYWITWIKCTNLIMNFSNQPDPLSLNRTSTCLQLGTFPDTSETFQPLATKSLILRTCMSEARDTREHWFPYQNWGHRAARNVCLASQGYKISSLRRHIRILQPMSSE
jgi:hypothetical protein